MSMRCRQVFDPEPSDDQRQWIDSVVQKCQATKITTTTVHERKDASARLSLKADITKLKEKRLRVITVSMAIATLLTSNIVGMTLVCIVHNLREGMWLLNRVKYMMKQLGSTMTISEFSRRGDKIIPVGSRGMIICRGGRKQDDFHICADCSQVTVYGSGLDGVERLSYDVLFDLV